MRKGTTMKQIPEAKEMDKAVQDFIDKVVAEQKLLRKS